MRVVLVADTFPPQRTSGAVQLRDLALEFVRQGHTLTAMLPAADLSTPWSLEDFQGVQVLRLRSPKNKDVNYVRRTIAEFLMPFAMLRNLRKSSLAQERWDGVVWYSPSVFHGPLVNALKKASGCKGYLIIRDIFPEWAVDIGLMGRGLPYRFFDAVARYQYFLANVIGVQTHGNQRYFDKWMRQPDRKLEVLQNWLGRPSQSRCSIRVDETALVGRKVFVYSGNMGVAQSIDIFLDLAAKMQSRSDVGFLFVGRGSESARLKAAAQSRQLDNVVFFNEIDPDEIPDLYAQCDAGIVALDSRNKSHNIPGKFIAYIQSGLPVLANINGGNDLAQMIRDERVGQVCQTNQIDELLLLTEKLLDQIQTDSGLSDRCATLFEREFAVENTVKKIVAAFSGTKAP
jgi:glycosyltransferase involved in cell wall biosynthesis